MGPGDHLTESARYPTSKTTLSTPEPVDRCEKMALGFIVGTKRVGYVIEPRVIIVLHAHGLIFFGNRV